MVMTSVSGHLLSLDFALAYKNWSVSHSSSLSTMYIQWNLRIMDTLGVFPIFGGNVVV